MVHQPIQVVSTTLKRPSESDNVDASEVVAISLEIDTK